MLQPTLEPKTERQEDGPIVSAVIHRRKSRTPATTTREKKLPKKRPAPLLLPASDETKNCKTRMPVITGEAYYKGMLPVDGILVGQMGPGVAGVSVRQKARSVFASQPELAGEINFEDMVRVNGHIAGTVYSKSGTLIVDSDATVEAHIDVAVAVIGGTVRGDIVARDRIELGPCATIYGNIWTRSLAIKDGASFDGVCSMIEDPQTVE